MFVALMLVGGVGSLLLPALASPAGADEISGDDAGGEPVTARHLVEMPHFVELAPSNYSNAKHTTALPSPDGRSVLVQTARSDVDTGEMIDSLWLLEASEIEEYLSEDVRQPPAPREVVQLATKKESGRLARVQWVSPTTIAYLAEGKNGFSQVFTASIDGAEPPRQLTASPTNVTAYGWRAGQLLYYAARPVSIPQTITVTAQTLPELLVRGSGDTSEGDVMLWRVAAAGDAVALEGSSVFMLPSFQAVWLSPGGKRAITLAPAAGAPRHWQDYRITGPAAFKPDMRRDDPTSRDLSLRTRYQLVDVETGMIAPLLDAPSGFSSGNQTPQRVFWLGDDRAIVTNTFLPLGVPDLEERQRRSRSPAIVEIDLASGSVTPILYEPVPEQSFGSMTDRILRIDWDESSHELHIIRGAVHGDQRMDVYRRGATGWHQVQKGTIKDHYFLEVQESATQRPILFAVGGACDCRRALFDPAPQAADWALIPSRRVDWVDRNGLRWKAGLLLPSSYQPGKPVPLVVQTHGYSEDEFILAGPRDMNTAFAAQALASVGIAVLQIEDNRSGYRGADEAALFAEGYRAGIEKLIAKGIADRQRIGMTVFSRTGLPAVRFLADYPELLAALDIADAAWWGYLVNLVAMENMDPTMRVDAEKVSGGMPDPFDTSGWIDRNPLYSITKARAAIRLEAIGTNIITNWEYYALLRRAKRPVELVYYPEGRHSLEKPAERMKSLGGAVDWFRFWLQGYEDPDPLNIEQYERWRQLRALQ